MEKPTADDGDRPRPGGHDGSQTWGTWEELLLACAVKRHGFRNWDSVSMEVQTRTSLPQPLTTARDCELKFNDLKRRFTKLSRSRLRDTDRLRNDDVSPSPGNEDAVDHIPWLDELRKLRVAELRRQVQRSEISILSLQLKVKRLEEERERSLEEKQGSGEENKPDLEVLAGCESENNEKRRADRNPAGPDSSEPFVHDGKTRVVCDESVRDNQSVNESNSTCSRSENGKLGKVEGDVTTEPEDFGGDSQNPVSLGNRSVEEESGNANGEGESVLPSEGKKTEDSSESRDSGAGGEVSAGKESGEVQSSATLTGKRKKRRRKAVSVGTSVEDRPDHEVVSVKSQPSTDDVWERIQGPETRCLLESLLEIQVWDSFYALEIHTSG